MTVTGPGLNAHEQSWNASGDRQPAPGNIFFERRKEARKVFILGAGLSGPVASYELVRAGQDVPVLEAQFRSGGKYILAASHSQPDLTRRLVLDECFTAEVRNRLWELL